MATVILNGNKLIKTPKARANVGGVNKTLRFKTYDVDPTVIYDRRSKRAVAFATSPHKANELTSLLNKAA